MRLAIDTNRYVDFCRGQTEAVERLRQAERVYLPFVVLAELRLFVQELHPAAEAGLPTHYASADEPT